MPDFLVTVQVTYRVMSDQLDNARLAALYYEAGHEDYIEDNKNIEFRDMHCVSCIPLINEKDKANEDIN